MSGGTVTQASLRGIPAFLRYLGTFPGPDAVAYALAGGPLAHLETTDVVLMRGDGAGSLIPDGWSRSVESLAARVPPIPVASELPIARAYRDGEPVEVTADRLHVDFPAMSYLETLIGEAHMPRAAVLVAAPITCQGRSVGGFAAWVAQPLQNEDFPLLGAVSAALGLWMTHPLAGLSTRAPSREARLLSERQACILRLVAEGKTNKAIASVLGYSESTVKLELSRTMELLKANDRRQAVQVARNLRLLEQAAPPGEVAG